MHGGDTSYEKGGEAEHLWGEHREGDGGRVGSAGHTHLTAADQHCSLCVNPKGAAHRQAVLGMGYPLPILLPLLPLTPDWRSFTWTQREKQQERGE